MRPNVLAVLRLMISWNFVGCSTSTSVVLSPLRLRRSQSSIEKFRRTLVLPQMCQLNCSGQDSTTLQCMPVYWSALS
jgi:hypothetical protein